MKVEVIAHTVTYPGSLPFEPEGTETDCDLLIEWAGRGCYGSWDKPNPATATNRAYIANIIAQGHFSVLEHASATFRIEGITRACSHELVRHRHASYSQRSTRYVDSTKDTWELPEVPSLGMYTLVGESVEQYMAESLQQAEETYAEVVSGLVHDARVPLREAREYARLVLPHAWLTDLTMTANLRSWWEIIAKRGTVHAAPEIREVACRVLTELQKISPAVFGQHWTVKDGTCQRLP